jgi:hypothetical protein
MATRGWLLLHQNGHSGLVKCRRPLPLPLVLEADVEISRIDGARREKRDAMQHAPARRKHGFASLMEKSATPRGVRIRRWE